MFVVCRLPGSGLDLSRSIRDMVLVLAEFWSEELVRHPLKPFYSYGIRYRPEPKESLAEEWVDPYVVCERGFGDCDDMVIWRLAEIFNESGYKAGGNVQRIGLSAWPCVYWQEDTGNYHVLIRHLDGRREDPAKLMHKKYGGPTHPS